MVESHGPVLGEELYHIGDDSVFVPLGEHVQVVLVETNETPERLDDDLIRSHVGDCVNEPNVVEGELDELSLEVFSNVVTHQLFPVLLVVGSRFEYKWVGGLDVVVDQTLRETTSLSLWQEEVRNLLFT